MFQSFKKTQKYHTIAFYVPIPHLTNSNINDQINVMNQETHQKDNQNLRKTSKYEQKMVKK